MGLDPNKYEVYKIDGDLKGPREPIDRLPVDSYFVLRKGDILAIPTLRSYQGHVRIVLDIEDNVILSDEQRTHLEELNVDIGDLLTKWEYDERKIPD